MLAGRQGGAYGRKAKAQPGGIFKPMLVREPPFIRLSTAFVDNLGLILRTALVIGAPMLVQEFRALTSVGERAVADADQPVPTVDMPATPQAPAEPVITDRVRHYLNCTYETYRADHYAECVEEPSRVYTSPQPGPDDMGHFREPAPVLLARIGVPPAD